MNNKLFITLTSIILLLVVSICGCFGEEKSEESDIVTIRDAYCDLIGNFHFTIVNLEEENNTIDFKWTLNDPMADKPVHEGNGSISLWGLQEKNLNFSIPSGLKDYDARFYVMHISLYRSGKSIYNYREQKSGYDWDYSVLPPIKFKDKPEHVHITFETFVSKNKKDDFVVQFENVTYNPSSSQIKLGISEFYIRIGDENCEEWLTDNIKGDTINIELAPKFFDIDKNDVISNYDYYVIPTNLTDKFEEKIVEFETACSFIYKGWQWGGELLQEEDKNAIIIKKISTNPENPSSLDNLEFIVEIQSKNHITLSSMELVYCSGGGRGSFGAKLQQISSNDNNYIYSGKFDDVHTKEGFDLSNEKYFYIELKDTNENERLILYKLEF